MDGAVRRHVLDPASLAAWRLDGTVQVIAAADVYAHEVGLDWPGVPFVFRGSGPEVYVLDFAEPDVARGGDADSGDPPDGADRPGDPGGSFPDGYGGDGSGGLVAACAVTTGHESGSWSLAVAMLVVLALGRRRRQ